ncbi:MAG: restriction endonuclease [Thermodesulfobacteriota bacterium]|nr:restriction endonuclease [Thermodesulfobacteriota bacterium]
MKHSDLPFGSEFSPSQIELPIVFQFADQYGGDWKAFEGAIYEKYFKKYATSEYNKRKLANNCKLGMIAYGIIDRDARLTPFGQKLLSLRNQDDPLYTELARHVLLKLHGLTLVQTIQDMETRQESINLRKLREWLEERNVHYPRGGKHPSIMRLWLEKAGIFARGSWRVNDKRLLEILGTSSEEIDLLSGFSPEQRAYLKTLANMGSPGPFPSNEVEKLATTTYGIKFDEKALPKKVLYPLQAAGYIDLVRGTKEIGRGAKPFLVSVTEKLVNALVAPLLETLEKQTRPDLRKLLRKSLPEILQEIKSRDKYLRGLALEALAFYLMRLIDLSYIATRLRGSATGGAEVDLIFEGIRLIFSRWQIQCKNTTRVSLDDVAKEVGLTHMLKSNVIVIVSTGEIGSEARRYSQHVMNTSNLDIILIDRDDLSMISKNPTYIADALEREAKRAMQIKKLDLEK